MTSSTRSSSLATPPADPLDQSVSTLFRVGPMQTKRLAKLGIRTHRDLLYHFPFRYEDLRHQRSIISCKPGEQVYLKGVVQAVGMTRLRGRKQLTEVLLTDETGSIKLIWFHQPYLAQTLLQGTPLAVCGKVMMNKYGLHLMSPAYEVVRGEQIHTGRIVPVYPTTAGITTKWMRSLIKQQLDRLSIASMTDPLPREVRETYELAGLRASLKHIHFPDSIEQIARAKRRLAFDELFLTQLGILMRKKRAMSDASFALKPDARVVDAFVASLPFTLTRGQQKVIAEILADLSRSHPMNRILEGDVGSGKTVVAVAALLACVSSGKQGFLMAPTEILALQHYERLCSMLAPFGVRVGLLTHAYQRTGEEKSDARAVTRALAAGRLDVLVGTHALLFSFDRLNNLGLVVVDEQHRFGVKQRSELQKKSPKLPHFLSMTATPIPRSLALTLYGDLDISILDETPAHKKPILTKIIQQAERKKSYTFVEKHIEAGHQVFVVCPLIDESDTLGVTSVKEEFEKLSTSVFPHRRIGMLHGKMKPTEKQRIIESFARGNLDILVSTSVIEVGIDIPNATIMMIEGAERFGLAQLHQFRGRVGRGADQSYCLLFSTSRSPATRARLRALEESSDGFALAQKDLELRGHGELYGTRQSGLPDFRIASLGDQRFLALTHDAAVNALRDIDQWPRLRKAADEFQREIHLE